MRCRNLLAPALLVVCLGGPAAGQSNLDVRLPDGTVVRYKHQATETPEETLRKMKRTCRKHLGRAEKFIGREDWYRARLALRLASNAVTDEEDFQAVRELLMKLEEVGRAMHDQARADFESERYEQGIEQLTIISYTFEGLPVGDVARQDLQAARSSPAIEKALENLKALELRAQVDRVLDAHEPDEPNDAHVRPEDSASGPSTATAPAARRPAEAVPPADVERIKALSAEPQLRVMSLLETIVRAYGRTECGRRSEALLTALRSDEPFMAELNRRRAQQAAQRALNAAEAFREGGLTDQAINRYRQILIYHADTPSADEARRRLAELEGARAAEQ